MSLTDEHRFGMQLAQMSRGWRAELDRRLAGLGLSQARWLVLLHLARFSEAPTQRELAQSVGVARLLDSLETQGLVQRHAVVEDRRAKKIELCAPARPLIEQIETIASLPDLENPWPADYKIYWFCVLCWHFDPACSGGGCRALRDTHAREFAVRVAVFH